ncbi:MAG: DNA repair protein RecO (recombination protein O) [Planctomycetota bacterium]|jgi:DNA repair protein RecO (recombination protein O)
MARLKDRALLLRRTPYGESSLVVHAFTRRHGRVHLLAKGAYRRTSRFFCVLDLFHSLELSWTTRPGRDLDPLAEGDLVQRRRRLPLDLEAFGAGSAILELLDLASPQGRVDTGLYDLAERALDQLEQGEEAGNSILLRFQLQFLAQIGIAPALRVCASCAGAAPAVDPEGLRAAFSAGAGGRLCTDCASETRRGGGRVGTLPVAVLEATVRAAAGPCSPELGVELRTRCLDLVSRFLDYQLDARLKSQRSFLTAANRNAPRPTPPSTHAH